MKGIKTVIVWCLVGLGLPAFGQQELTLKNAIRRQNEAREPIFSGDESQHLVSWEKILNFFRGLLQFECILDSPRDQSTCISKAGARCK